MEPSTVGQAPKDIVANVSTEPAAQQSYVGQATSAVGGAVSGALAVAGNVAGAVGGAVGLGHAASPETKTDADKPVAAKNEGGNVEISDRTVEEYLREQSGATPKPIEKK